MPNIKQQSSWEVTARLALLMLVTPALGLALAAANSSETFFDALTNPAVNIIDIPPDNFKLRFEDWAAFNRTHPYVLDRDVLIRSAAPPALGQMDFQFLMRKVLLGPNVTLTLDRLVLLNVNKLGGFGLDFFMGDTGSVIQATDSVRVKMVCPPAEQSLQAAQAFSAPEGFPANTVSLKSGVCIAPSKQQTDLKCYDDAVFFQDFTLQVGTVDPDAGISQPGYRLVMRRVSRVCQNYITAECIRQSSEDLCTAQLLSTLLASPSADSSWRPQTIAGVVIGAVVGFLAASCLAGFMLWKHRHWWRSANSNRDESKGHITGAAVPGAAVPGRAVRQDSAQDLRRQLLPGTGSQRSDPQAAVKLGVLLGSGSFGRVFKGRWHGMDVAVKVMDPCSPDTLPKVLREAEVMMALNHPNIVKAYQCSVWSKKQQEQMLQAAQQRTASEAGGQRRWQPRMQPQGGRHSSSSVSPHSSTTASQVASSSSTAADLQPQPTSASAAGAASDKVVINIVPEIIPRSRQPLAVVSAAGAAPASVGTSTSSSSTAAGALSSSSIAAAAGGKPAAMGGVSEPTGSSASAARRMFSKLWRHQTQQQPEQQLQGPPTASTGQEPAHVPATPLSSAAYALSGCSSMDVTVTGTSAHTAAGVISSTSGVGSFAIMQTAAVSQGGRAMGSGSSMGPGMSGLVSSQGHTVSSAGRSSSAGGASQADTQPTEIRPVLDPPWRAGRSSSSGGVQGVVSHSESDGSKPRSPEGGGGISEGGSSGQEPLDEMQVWLVLELCTGGSLRDAVACSRIKTSSVQDMAKLLSRLLDAANGLAYLHSQDVVHGDLKAANVLLQHSVQGTYGQVAKVSDFGVSARLLDGATHRSTASLGTITHVAPEVLSSGRLSKAADVYAFGIMMFEVFTNQTAYAGCHSGAIVERVVIRGERPPVPRSMPPQYALLMQRCWAANPDDRPSFEQVIACLDLLLDNLTSSDDEGHISEGVEEEHNTTSTSSSCGDGEGGAGADRAAAGKAAAAVTAAPAAGAAEAAGLKQSFAEPQTLSSPGPPQASWEGASTPGASSSRGGGRFTRPLSRGSDRAGGPRQQDLAESVEGACDGGVVSGPSTPGFRIDVQRLLGMRQWYDTHTDSLEALQEPDLEAPQPAGCSSSQAPAAAFAGEPSAAGIVPYASPRAAYRAAYRARRLVQPWLDQCSDAPTPPRLEQPLLRISKQRWASMGRWLRPNSAENWSAAAAAAAAQVPAASTYPAPSNDHNAC